MSFPVKINRSDLREILCDYISMRIARFVRAWRVREELTLQEASERLKVPFQTIHRLEKGSPMDGSTLAKIIDYMLGSDK